MILALLTALALCAEPVPEALPELPSEPPAFRLPKPSPIPPSERGMDMTMEFSAREIRRWHRGRKVGISGIFLGMAGVGLAAGGFTLAVGGRGEGSGNDASMGGPRCCMGGRCCLGPHRA